jgi:hypothetical protein
VEIEAGLVQTRHVHVQAEHGAVKNGEMALHVATRSRHILDGVMAPGQH